MPARRLTFTILSALALGGCHKTVRAQPDRLIVRARLEHVDATRVALAISLSRPVTKLPFTRPGNGDRARTFRVLAPVSASIAADGREEALIAATPFTSARLEIPIHDAHMSEKGKDYAPFFTLADGGVFVYSGQLDLGEQSSTEVRYEFVPLPGQYVSVLGRAARGPLEWTANQNGTYVAFTRQPPVEEKRYISVIDPGFPARFGVVAASLLPQLFDRFTATLGKPLPMRPTVLLSYRGTETGGLSMKGGVLSGFLLSEDISLDRDWQTNPRVISLLRLSLAHETAHFWNNEVVRNVGPAWLHEGSAEVLAQEALHALGHLDDSAFEQGLSRAASECALLRGTGALEADSAGAWYACGAVALMVGSRGPGAEAVWRELIARAAKRGTYDAAAMFEACLAAGAPAEAVEAASRLTAAGTGPGSVRVVAALRAGGFRVQEGAPPAEFQRFGGRLGHPKPTWLVVSP